MTLTLSLLGSFQASLNDNPITKFRSNRVQALLIYLAVEQANTPHQRDKLLDLFWPGMPQKSAQNNLRQTIYQLRQAIPDHNNIPFIIATRKTIQRNPDYPLHCDVTHFEALLTQSNQAWTEAITLYRGDFLEDFYLPDAHTFEEWATRHRAAYRQQLFTVYSKLIAWELETGNLSTALQHAHNQLQIDNLRESAHYQLIELLARSGQRTEAIRQYETCVQILDEELNIAPSLQLTTLYNQIISGDFPPPKETKSLPSATPILPPTPPTTRLNWGEAPDVTIFHGRQTEIAKLSQWLLDDQCRLVGILGMGGLGKTALVTRLAEQVQTHFQYLIWRSLCNVPPLAEILADWVLTLSDQQTYDLPDEIDKRISLLLDHLRQKRCLLILDNAESILQAGEKAGHYRVGYEDYGQLLQRVGESRHQSCLLLTSREKPRQFGFLESQSAPVRTLPLANIDTAAGQAILQDRGLTGTAENWATLLDRYSGNPLALKLVAETVRELFWGEIADFLQEESTIFGGIRDLLTQHFDRLSELEQEVLVWLAIEREPISPDQLQENIVRPISRRDLLQTLRNLHRRSLLEQTKSGFTLQNVVMEFLTDYLVETICQEIQTPQTAITDNFNRYALLKAQAKEYVRASQKRLILAPIVDQLLGILGKNEFESRLDNKLYTLRQTNPNQSGYAGGNILNLLLHLNRDVKDFDFSKLAIRQVNLRGVRLPNVNFTMADLTDSVFTDTFGAIETMAFSPDGKLLAAGTVEGQIRVWQTKDGRLVSICEGHDNWVSSIIFSPDGQVIVSDSFDDTVRLWDAKTGRNLKVLSVTPFGSWQVAFNPEGQILATGGNDGSIRLWDVQTWQCLNTLEGHTRRVRALAFSPNGQILISGSYDQTIRIWNVETGQTITTLLGHSHEVSSVTFSSDGKTFLSGSGDHTIRLWDVTTMDTVKIFSGHTRQVRSVAFSPDNQIIASASDDRTVRLWDVNGGQNIKTISDHTNNVKSVIFSPDGQTFASGGHDRLVHLWDTDTGHLLKTLSGHTNPMWSVAFSLDGQTLATAGGMDRTVHMWHIGNNDEYKALKGHAAWVWFVAFSPDGQVIASGSQDLTIRLWDLSNMTWEDSDVPFQTLLGHTDEVRSVAFSPDGQFLVSSGEDHTVRLWDVRSNLCLNTLAEHTEWIMTATFSPDGQLVASGSHDFTARLWDAHTGKCLRTLSGHTMVITQVAFSPDSKILASGSLDHTVRLWDVQTGQQLNVLSGHTDWIYSVAFSPNGRILASAGTDRTVQLWDISSGQNFKILSGHSNVIRFIAFSPDGRLLASCGIDGTVKLWDVQSGECVKMLRPERPYERMNITGVTGLTEAQKTSLKLLGAIDNSD